MKKTNNPNKRQAAIIKYLSENGKVTTDEIRRILINDENYGKIIPKSTLSEDINFLRSIGYPIVTSYGYISLDKQETDNEVVYHEKLCQSVIRKWIILYNTIFGYSSDECDYSHLITKTELKSSCSAISRSQFYKDLKALKKEGYIDYDDEMKRSPYRKNEGYIDIDDDDDETKHSPPVFPCGDFLRFVNIDKRKASKMYKLLNNEIGIVFFKELKELLEKYWPEICSSDEFVPGKMIVSELFHRMLLICLNVSAGFPTKENAWILLIAAEKISVIQFCIRILKRLMLYLPKTQSVSFC